MGLITNPSTELDDTTIIDVDPVVVVTDGSKGTPDSKVVSRREPPCRMLVRHASRVKANELDRVWPRAEAAADPVRLAECTLDLGYDRWPLCRQTDR